MENQKITKDANIAELVKKYPQTVQVLIDEELGCIGCVLAQCETIGQGLVAHGKTEEEVTRIIKHLNEALGSGK